MPQVRCIFAVKWYMAFGERKPWGCQGGSNGSPWSLWSLGFFQHANDRGSILRTEQPNLTGLSNAFSWNCHCIPIVVSLLWNGFTAVSSTDPVKFWLILFSFSQLPGGKQFPWPWFYCILAWSKNCRVNGLRNCQVSGEFQSLLASFVLPRIIGSNHWTLHEFDIADQSVSIIQMIWQG